MPIFEELYNLPRELFKKAGLQFNHLQLCHIESAASSFTSLCLGGGGADSWPLRVMHLNLHRIVCPLSNLLSITSRQRVKECRACSVIAMYLHIEVNWHFKFIKFMFMLMTSGERDDDVGECFRRCVWVC